MKRFILTALVLFPALGLTQSRVENWKFNEQETIQRTFNVAPGAKINVDNVNGYVHVTGNSGSQVQATVQKRIDAESGEALQDARRDVKLDITEQNGDVKFYVDGPFRTKDGDVNYRGDERYGYRVTYDFEVQVPANAEVVLRTMNHGEILVKNVSGNFDIHGLNGGIEMQEISGAGTAQTLNGPLKISFARNPSKDAEFKTLNGTVDAYFPAGLNADVHFKTLNGGVYSDFDVTPLPQQSSGRTEAGRFVYRSNRQGSARIGGGGPQLKFDTLNGSIRLHSKAL